MTLNLVGNFECPVNLPGNVGFAPLAAWQRFFAAILTVGFVSRVISGCREKQIALKASSGGVANQQGPRNFIVLVVGKIVTVRMRASVVVANYRLWCIFAIPSKRRQVGRNQDGAGDKGVHGKLRVSEGNARILSSYSAYAIAGNELFTARQAVRAFFLGKSGDARRQNYPVAAHFSGFNPPLSAELKHALLCEFEGGGGFCWCANQVKRGLGHDLQRSEVLA